MRILFLDDDGSRISKFKEAHIGQIVDVATTADDAVAFLRKNEYDWISLDHDLLEHHYGRPCGHRDGCGYRVAEFIASRPRVFGDTPIEVHTLGEENGYAMVTLLRDAGVRRARRKPFRL